MLEKLFKLSQHNTNIKTEVFAGITTFLTMAYIIFVQPAVLSTDFLGQPTGLDFGAVLLATCIISAFSTVLMGLLANYASFIPDAVNAIITETKKKFSPIPGANAIGWSNWIIKFNRRYVVFVGLVFQPSYWNDRTISSYYGSSVSNCWNNDDEECKKNRLG